MKKKSKKKDRWSVSSFDKSNEIWNSIGLALRGTKVGSKIVRDSATGYKNYLKAESEYWKSVFGLDSNAEDNIYNQIGDHYQRSITEGLFDLRSFTMAGRIVPWFYLDLIGKRRKGKVGRRRRMKKVNKPIVDFYPQWVLDAFVGKDSNPKLNAKLGEIRVELESKFVSSKRIIQLGEEVFKLHKQELEKEKKLAEKQQEQLEQQQKEQGQQDNKNQDNQDIDQDSDEDLEEDYESNQSSGSNTDSEEQQSEQSKTNQETNEPDESEDSEAESDDEDESEDSKPEPKSKDEEAETYSNEDSVSNLMQPNNLQEKLSDDMELSERDEIAELSSWVQDAKDLMQKFSAKEKTKADLQQGLTDKQVTITEKGKKTIIKCKSNEDKELAKKLRKALVLRQQLETNLDIAGTVVDVQQYIKSKYQLNTEVFKQPQLKRGAKIVFSGDVSGSMSHYIGLQKRIFAILLEAFKGLIDFDQVWFTTGGYSYGYKTNVSIIRGEEIPYTGITPILYSTHFLLNQLRVDGYLKSILIVFTDLGENCAIKRNKSLNDLVIKANRNRCQIIFAVPSDCYDDAYYDNQRFRKSSYADNNSFIDWFKFPVLKMDINKQDQLLKDLLALIRQFRLI